MSSERWLKSEILGSGTSSFVYKTILRKETVAVKVPRSPSYNDKFLYEGKVYRSLFHNRIVALRQFDDDPESPLIYLEWCSNGTLRNALARGRLPNCDILTIAKQSLEGLEYLHGKGLIHGDLKPDNILLDAEKNVKIGDFGHTRYESTSPTIIGAEPYMAPEVLSGKGSTRKSDMWSWIIIICEMALGRIPNQFEICHNPIDWTLSPGFKIRNIIRGLLTKESTRRLQLRDTGKRLQQCDETDFVLLSRRQHNQNIASDIKKLRQRSTCSLQAIQHARELKNRSKSRAKPYKRGHVTDASSFFAQARGFILGNA